MSSPVPYAHSVEARHTADWEPLDHHLERVAARAGRLAECFDARPCGELAGRWHDLGKFQPAFQQYLLGQTPAGPPHAWAGALLAATRSRESKAMIPLALAIAGHHAGLADFRRDEAATAGGAGAAGPTPLLDLIAANKEAFAQLRRGLPQQFLDAPLPALPSHVTDAASTRGAGMDSRPDLFTRFLFSALVDADRLETARFRARFLPGLTADDLRYDDVSTLRARLDAAIDGMPPRGSPAVVELRREVLHACR